MYRLIGTRPVSGYWEEIYRGGHRQNYPWDAVVSFVFGSAPKDVPRGQVQVLEVGFGTGSNLWFAAREGFSVAGIEMNPAAVNAARERFAEDGLHGELEEGSFTSLPFADTRFDLVIDRAALTCSPLSEIGAAFREIARVTRPGGRFFFNPYAGNHTSAASGRPGEGCVRENIETGSLAGLDRIAFLEEVDVRMLFSSGWEIESMKLLQLEERAGRAPDMHSEWRVVARRV